MARAKKIDPCGCKGRDLGSLGVGRRYGSNVDLPQPTGRCGLLDGQFCRARGQLGEPRFALNKKAESSQDVFKKRKSFAKTTRDELPVVPCNQTFLHSDSAGTKAWRKLNPDTKFRGCYELEKEIRDKDFMSLRPGESFGKRFDVIEQMELSDRWSDHSVSGGPEFEALYYDKTDGRRKEIKLKKLTRWSDKIERDLHLGFESFAPLTIESGSEAHVLRERGERLARENRLRRHSPRFIQAVKGLTIRQRRAARYVYLENHEDLTRAEIAARLGISLDSLKDRLLAVRAKFLRFYPERALVNEMRKSETEKLRAAELARHQALKDARRATALAPCRYLNPSEGLDVTYLCRADDPHPFGGELRPRAGIDASEIRAKIRLEFTEKFSALYRATEMSAPPKARDNSADYRLGRKMKAKLWRGPET